MYYVRGEESKSFVTPRAPKVTDRNSEDSDTTAQGRNEGHGRDDKGVSGSDKKNRRRPARKSTVSGVQDTISRNTRNQKLRRVVSQSGAMKGE